MTTRAIERVPYGVGRWSAGWWVFMGAMLVLFGWGVFAYSQQFIEGLVVTGMRDIGSGAGSAWALYISFDVYFVGISLAGITTAALIRLLDLQQLRPVSRMAELLALISAFLSIPTVLADLGQPGRGIVNLPLYARPQSPFFGTMALLISVELFAGLVYLYLAGRRDAYLCAQKQGGEQWLYRLWAAGYRDTPEERERHNRTSWWLALAIIPLMVIAYSTLGFIFGIQVGRPGWFSALQAPSFVILAGVSGIGLLIIIAALLRWVLGLKDQLNLEVFRWLGNFLWVLTVGYLYFLAVQLLTATYTAHHHERLVTDALLFGSYAWLFWLSVGLLVIPFLILFIQFAVRRYSLLLIVLAGIMVNLAAIGKRYLIVVPSQTHGTILPYLPGYYSPTWVEYSVILGVFALGSYLYVLFIKAYPIMEVPAIEGRE